MEIYSPVFKNKGELPEKYAKAGNFVNPPLRIRDVPEKTASLVLIIDDPYTENGVKDYLIVWDMPPGTKEIKENSIPNGAFYKKGSGCGPPGNGRACVYHFKLYALDRKIGIKPKLANKFKIEEFLYSHTIKKARIIGVGEVKNYVNRRSDKKYH